jgi:hypothetical protein
MDKVEDINGEATLWCYACNHMFAVVYEPSIAISHNSFYLCKTCAIELKHDLEYF